MNMVTGFFSDDLNVYYKNYDEPDEALKDVYQVNERNLDFCYKLFWFIEGTAFIQTGEHFSRLNGNNLVFANVNDNFYFKIKQDSPYRYAFITIHPKVFERFNIEDGFLRPFHNFKNTDTILSFDDKRHCYIEEQLESIRKCVFLDLSINHILPRVFAIISELCILNDAAFAHEVKDTDSIPVKIMAYIGRNYCQKITAADLSERFFISFPTLNSIIRLYTGMTVWQYITDLRLEDAKKMLEEGVSGVKAAELCGFANYGCMYKAYKKKYGVTPSENKTGKYRKWSMT